MKKEIIIILFFLFTHLLRAQDKPLRVEIEAKSNSDSYVIIPFGEKGVLLFYQSNENADRINNKWYFTLYDVNFKELWTKESPVRKDLHITAIMIYICISRIPFQYLQKEVSRY